MLDYVMLVVVTFGVAFGLGYLAGWSSRVIKVERDDRKEMKLAARRADGGE